MSSKDTDTRTVEPKDREGNDNSTNGDSYFSDSDKPAAPSSSQQQQLELEPRIQPLGILTRFVRNEETSLIMTRKLPSATFEDFIVTDSRNKDAVVFRCHGHAKSLHQKMSKFGFFFLVLLYDMQITPKLVCLIFPDFSFVYSSSDIE